MAVTQPAAALPSPPACMRLRVLCAHTQEVLRVTGAAGVAFRAEDDPDVAPYRHAKKVRPQSPHSRMHGDP
jgi:hypothetical protein